jgi:hypothetical protein
MAQSFSRGEIKQLLNLLNDELRRDGISARINLVGGAVMCLVFDARRSTKDLDAFFEPTERVREAAARVAAKRGIDADWLNDGVKAFVSAQGEYSDYLELSNLQVFTARPETMFAMKCLALRLGAEFQDEDDIKYLLRTLDIRSYDQAVEVITIYYPLDRFPKKTLYFLEEILRRGAKE